MISEECITYDWIKSNSKKGHVQDILLEKMIRALILLEGLAESDLNFVFKGGTSLVLLLDPIRRLSIDIDIITPDKNGLDEILQKICEDKGFLRYERNFRQDPISAEFVEFSESVKSFDFTESVKSIDFTESVKSIDFTESVKSIDFTESVKSIDFTESVKSIDFTESVKSIDFTESVKSIDFTESVRSDEAVKAPALIQKEHYKLYYESVLGENEEYVLLDVLREEILYTKTVFTDIFHEFLLTDGENIIVQIPDCNNLLGDKLTAFAPNTSGIPYQKNGRDMGMEIIKQMFDIGCLFDEADDMQVVAEVFTKFAETELSYRKSGANCIDVLNDIIETALAICLNEDRKNTNLKILNRGLVSVRSYIFSGKFNMNQALIASSKTAYAASIIKTDRVEINRFKSAVNVKDLKINGSLDTKTTRMLKKVNPEAFYYLYQISLISGEE
ncbi:hypothetical protein MmiHf6_07110 [Methanimicrococcus hongohii]|uniref:Nucleotidyl transferase AbiEii/AbiGii toxin family protein n=1 Tax=Methanimicrococcus hongohii TaxID=3028295 RepID=A0AA96ZSG7_9EURY|nr:nucleotidyl transferase AbiEii/AbiGii toxin family protein [Methanimicrococcus sp. Hf6]WNY23404.1 hypothetical protein MmiHf6_07110 [Methanimicrococcus sp. Hf6]